MAGQKAEGQPDHELLEQFVSQRDEMAFASLLERHGPMVLGVCRRLLHDEHLTEDAFQATFLVLARNAGEIRKRESVAGYLHRVAMNMARKLRARVRSSLQPSQRRSESGRDAPAQLSWREEQEILDQELQRLPEKYRLPLLLCYLEGRTRDEAAVQLGWSTGKLRGLLDRGREQLRALLIRRGVTLSTAFAASLMTDTAFSATVPPLLAVSTVKTSFSFAAGTTLAATGVSTTVASLVEGTLIMGSKNTMWMLALVVLTGVLGASIGTGAFKGQEQTALAVDESGVLPPGCGAKADTAKKDAKNKATSDSLPDGAMVFHFSNNTKGKFKDDQIYWAVLGNGAKHLDINGKLVPMVIADNTAPGHLTKKGVNYANYFLPLSTANKVVVPKMNSGRLYISMGSPMYFRVHGEGYAGANICNPTDPNRDVYFDFVEFTLNDSGFHGNTTQVDAFGFPLTIEVVNTAGDSKMAGIRESRKALFAAFNKDLPKEFASCIQEPYRIVAPCSADFGKGKTNGNYLDGYIDEVWKSYSTPTRTPGGWTGQVVDGSLVFTGPAGKSYRLARKPTTQEALLGNGILGSSPQFCAAINRHVLADPADWSKPSKYYKAGPANYYAKFWHDHGITGKAYGFCYDDVNAQDTLIELRKPTRLNVSVSWD
jgi:RNA polymerase sigma factor (sigma-70 family)